jgi:AmpE protein
MKLLAVLVAWGLHQWFSYRPGWQSSMARLWRLLADRQYPAWVMVVLALAVGLLATAFFALVRFLFGDLAVAVLSLLLLWLSLGDSDLVGDVRQAISAYRNNDVNCLRHALARLGAGGAHDKHLYERHLVEAVFAAAIRRWLAPIFWFVVLGIGALVFYGMVQTAARMLREEQLPSHWQGLVDGLLRGLTWPVAVLVTLGLAVTASADVTLRAVRRYWQCRRAEALRLETGFLDAALHDTFYLGSEASPVLDELAEPEAVPPGCLRLSQGLNLLWRVMLFLLTLLALATVIGWAQ